MSWLREVYGSNPAIKLLIDPETGAIVDANDAAAQFYGFGVEELRGLTIQDINSLPERDVRAEMSRARAGNRGFFRFIHRRARGDFRHVEVFTGPVDVEGKTLLLSIVHDVTERENALTALARAESRQRALMDALPIGVAVHRDDRVFWINEGFARIVGREPSALVGATLESLFPAAERAFALDRLASLEESSMPSMATPLLGYHLLRADGHAVPVELRALPFASDGEPCSLLIVVDTSERVRLEEDLHRAQRMDAIGRVSGGVAHDFNNLLFVILGAADAISRFPKEHPHFATNLTRIREAAQRAADLTRQLLLVSRGDEARGERVEIDEAVRNIVGLVAGSLDGRVDVQLTLAPGLAVHMPRASFDQVLLNLIVNARDAMPDGGTLRITAEAVDVGNCPFGRLSVEDTGTGMPADILVKAFEPFFTTKDPDRGTGLGLSTAYGIVRRAGGTIELTSECGRGTTARVMLPLAESSTPPRPGTTTREPPPSSRSRVVLLVDDQRHVRELVEMTLVEAGYKVVAASSAQEALAIAANTSIGLDVLLTDVVMPKMRGPELAAKVRLHRANLPVVYMSGFTGDALSEAGVDPADLLEKPFDTTELYSAVERALTRRAPG